MLKIMKHNYSKICSNLLKGLPERVSDVIKRRFGLAGGSRETLEAIGKNYEITRERVRQIEEEGLLKIRPEAKNYGEIFEYFNSVIKSLGGLKKEEVLVNELGLGKHQNEIFFLLNLGEGFKRHSEDRDLYPFWATKPEAADLAKNIVKAAISTLENEKKILDLDEIYRQQKSALPKNLNKNIFSSYLEISKRIAKNPEGRFGLADWVEINPRGIKDKAYLIFKKAGKNLHFTEVATLIEKSPYSHNKKVHVATVHNELIKDPRFVLVGRGLYALKEWGYEEGVVKDIILKVLKDSEKPLTKDEVLKKVLAQRVVKENTVFLNLQNKNFFSRTGEGKYTVKEA